MRRKKYTEIWVCESSQLVAFKNFPVWRSWTPRWWCERSAPRSSTIFPGSGYRVLFIEYVCDDPVVQERNYKEILRYSADYVGMDSITAEEDLRLKIAHYIRSYEPMDEKTYPRIRIDTGSMDIESCNVSGHVETNVLGYLGSVTVEPHTLYFSRVGNPSNFTFVIV